MDNDRAKRLGSPSRSFISAVILCTLVAVVDGFDTQSIAYIAPSLAQDWHVPVYQFGNVFGAGLFGLMLGAMLIGPLADRAGRQSIIIGSCRVPGCCLAAEWLAVLTSF